MADQFTTVRAGERIDTLAFRVLGDSTRYLELVKANPHLDLWHPTPGQKIKVPNAN
jgi:prophage DNA circulation protein